MGGMKSLAGRDFRRIPAFLKETAEKLLIAMVLWCMRTASGN
jgi:hypothetical protein